jgi:hypothetical protein
MIQTASINRGSDTRTIQCGMHAYIIVMPEGMHNLRIFTRSIADAEMIRQKWFPHSVRVEETE